MPVLEVHDLKKQYVAPDGQAQLVVDVPAFSMEAGHQIGLRGTSGSGKTTFLNLIAGILRPDSGHVILDGIDVSALSETKRDAIRAKHLGYVFQTFNLLMGYSALENVLLGMMFGPGPDRELARHLLDRVGLSDRMDHRPGQLSVGQQQRVALARALANRPSIVLADEPTGNLDPYHSQEAMRMIREICSENNAALLLVSHDTAVLDQFEMVQKFADINCALASPQTETTS